MKHEVRYDDVGGESGEAYVSQWYKERGDPVAEGEPIAELVTDKASFEIETTVAGVVAEILVEEEERVTTGQVLAVIESR